MRALVEDPADGRQRSGLSGCISTRCEGAAGMGRASPCGGVVLLRHEMRCLYLRPLPLRERAAWSFNKQDWVRGSLRLSQAKRPPHPTEPAARSVRPSPARGEGADTSTAFHDAARLLPEDVAPHFGGGGDTLG